MYKDFPYIKIFQLVTGNYVYDINKNTIIKIIDNRTFSQILEINKYGWTSFLSKNDINNFEFKGLKLLMDKNYLQSNNIEEIENTNYEICRTYIENCMNHIILQVTQNCNLRCSYCPYAWDGYMDRKHKNKNMDWETAQHALEFFIDNSYDSDQLAVSFYGGEPLLEFDLIKKCIRFMSDKVKSKPLTFHMTTNGTLINREFLDFIGKYDFGIYISLDGPQKIHDKNRKFGINGEGSYNKVYENLKLIINEYPNLTNKFFFNAVWDGSNPIDIINDFFEHDNVISKLGGYNLDFIDDGSIVTDVSITDYNYNMQQKQYLNFLIDILQNRLDITVTNEIKNLNDGFFKLNEQFNLKNPLNKKRFQSGPCIPGCSKLFVDVEGNLFPCEKCSDKCVSFGNINKKDIINYCDIHKQMNLNGMVKDKCKTCWAFRFCKICSVFVANGDSFSDIILDNECQLCVRNMTNSIRDFIYLHELGSHVKDNIFSMR